MYLSPKCCIILPLGREFCIELRCSTGSTPVRGLILPTVSSALASTTFLPSTLIRDVLGSSLMRSRFFSNSSMPSTVSALDASVRSSRASRSFSAIAISISTSVRSILRSSLMYLWCDAMAAAVFAAFNSRVELNRSTCWDRRC